MALGFCCRKHVVRCLLLIYTHARTFTYHILQKLVYLIVIICVLYLGYYALISLLCASSLKRRHHPILRANRFPGRHYRCNLLVIAKIFIQDFILDIHVKLLCVVT